MVINQDHYALETFYTPGDYTYTREQIGTRYLFIAVRTLVDPADPEDVKQARALRGLAQVRAKRMPERFVAFIESFSAAPRGFQSTCANSLLRVGRSRSILLDCVDLDWPVLRTLDARHPARHAWDA